MRIVLLAVLLSGCLPSFDLEDRTFGPEDGGGPPEVGLDAGEDAGPEDTGPEDTGPEDTGPEDTGPEDTGLEDAGPRDEGVAPDAAEEDGGTEDAGTPEICDNGEDDDEDGATDCADQDCTVSVCPDDQNVCTRSICISPDGTCDVAETGASGPGWMCVGIARRETGCDDGVDNDGDGDADCHDLDCPNCLGMLLCCPAGNCALICN